MNFAGKGNAYRRSKTLRFRVSGRSDGCHARGEDCKGIAFWRRPLTRGPKVQGEEYANLSGKRTEFQDFESSRGQIVSKFEEQKKETFFFTLLSRLKLAMHLRQSRRRLPFVFSRCCHAASPAVVGLARGCLLPFRAAFTFREPNDT